MIRPATLFLMLTISAQPAAALCPSLDMSKGYDQVAKSVIAGSDFVFLGTIAKEDFVGDAYHAETDSNASVDITYHVERIFKGAGISEFSTIRTPFFREDCAISNPKEVKEAIDAAVGDRKIVYAWTEIDENGRKHQRVSGGCPESIDAPPYGYGNKIIEAFSKASR